MIFQSINPTNNKVVKSFEAMSDATLGEAVSKAAGAYDEWKKTDYKKGLSYYTRSLVCFAQKEKTLLK